MPKTAARALIWSAEQEIYELRKSENAQPLPVEGNNWFAELTNSSSFAFHGQRGNLTLRRETRQHSGESYWYAYRNQGHRTLKRYAGRSGDLSIARLEEIAATLNHTPDAGASDPLAADASPTARKLANQKHTAQSTRGPARQEMPLLAPKLSLPRLPTKLVARETLLARLDAGLERKLTLLSAPAGFGKTTLAGQWIAHLSNAEQRPSVAWVALDERDNDPVRFWNYVITACQAFSGATDVALRPLESAPFEQISLETSLTLLLNTLSQAPARIILVLEDYHVISEPGIHSSLAFLLDHLPATLHLVIITRAEPPLPLVRLRAGGEMSEFGADALRLSREETREFLVQTLAISPQPELVIQLDALIEGWVTGLRLLTLTLQGEASEQALERSMAGFSGGQRHLLEYFVHEVLARQTPEVQDFLLQTCAFNSLSASLCAALTGRDDSELLLGILERANLFLQPLAGHERWYRYHPLFAEALRYEAKRRLSDEARRACSERASAWYEQHAQWSEAIEAALIARSFARAAALIERRTSPQRFHEMREHSTLQRWLLALPEAILRRHPRLCLSLAMALLFVGDCQKALTPEVLARVEQPLRMAEESWQAEEDCDGLGEAMAFRVVIARFQGDFARATRLARQALAWLNKDARQWRATCLVTIGEEERLAGDLEAARRTLLQAHTCFEAVGNHYGQRVILLMLAEICALQGNLRESAALFQEVLDTANEDLADRGQALLGLAGLAYEWNDLAMAEAQAQEALEIGARMKDEACQLRASLVLANIQYARRQITRARQRFATLLAHAQRQASPLLYRELLTRAASLQLIGGDLAPAQRWLSWQAAREDSTPLLHQGREQLLRARLLSAQGKSSEALDLLSAVRAAAHQQGNGRDEIEALLLTALTLNTQQYREQAWSILQEALIQARTEGYLRLFVDEGEAMAALLRVLPPLDEKKQSAYLRSLLLAFAREQTEQGVLTSQAGPLTVQSIEPLSAQEQRVLQLLLAGYSNREIAESLVVSPNTVKTQTQSIYRKLNVHSRKEARQVIREQHLA